MALLALQVIWIRDEFIRPPGPKMIACVEPDKGWFFRINSKDKWPVPVLLEQSLHRGFLTHDSYLECGSPLEISDYLIEQSLERDGILGSLDPCIAQRICDALGRSHKISPNDRALIVAALGCAGAGAGLQP